MRSFAEISEIQDVNGTEAKVSFRNPKRSRAQLKGRARWYDYYAGFSTEFVEDAINFLKMPAGSVILDPWNGSGATTQIAAEKGYRSVGFDINPVMVIVAKARSISHDLKSTMMPLLDAIATEAASSRYAIIYSNDPLDSWLRPRGVKAFRRIDAALQKLLVLGDYGPLFSGGGLREVSSLAAFFYTALFRTLRELLKPFRASNPTWIKGAASVQDLLDVTGKQALMLFKEQVGLMLADFSQVDGELLPYPATSSMLSVASSEKIPLPGRAVDGVVSSPPYCTRIDYAVATKVELAVLGINFGADLKGLRTRMIGTPTVVDQKIEPRQEWGKTCELFLDEVRGHKSKASATYYLKQHLQYFDSMYRSVSEIDRVVKKGGRCILVVQDSYYKDIHNDLPTIISEMVTSLGWDLEINQRYEAKISMRGVNRQARGYRHAMPAEHVLTFKTSVTKGEV